MIETVVSLIRAEGFIPAGLQAVSRHFAGNFAASDVVIIRYETRLRYFMRPTYFDAAVGAV